MDTKKNMKDKRISVVGVSENKEKYGYKIFESLINAEFNVDGINAKGGRILGRRIYKNIAELPYIPDLVLTVVGPAITEKIVGECAQAKVREIWMQPGSESDNAIKKAQKYGLKVTSSACFMVHLKIW